MTELEFELKIKQGMNGYVCNFSMVTEGPSEESLQEESVLVGETLDGLTKAIAEQVRYHVTDQFPNPIESEE